MAQQHQPLFGLVAAGTPVVVTPTETLTPTSWLYSLPPPPGSTKRPSHLTVFLAPDVALPPNTAAAVYLVTPPAPGAAEPASTFIGGVGPGKESAVFALGGGSGTPATAAAAGPQNLVVGISLEDGAAVTSRIAERAKEMAAANAAKQQQQPAPAPVDTVVLAQRIISNAFHFLASFSVKAGAVDMVPLKKFEEWWRRFEARLRSDPGFLERYG